MKKPTAKSGLPALELLERAVHLLRTAPARTLFAYYVGAVPFVLGLLHFFADMSRGAYAQRRCPAAALGLALLFLWLKCWQAAFTAGLRARLAGGVAPKWDLARCVRLVFFQGIVQPSRLLLLPLAALATVPLGWVLAFYENATVVGDGSAPEIRATMRRAAAQSRLWPAQNHMLLAVLGLLAVMLWLNALIALVSVPQLLKLLLGVETDFSRAGSAAIFNTTFLAATLALAWLVFDPLIKAVYTLRCFHGEARQDGADLLADLAFVRTRNPALVTAALSLLLLLPLSVVAAEPAASPPAASPAPVTAPPDAVPAPELDDALKRTLQRDKYAWRLPREKLPEQESGFTGWLRSFFQSIAHTLLSWARSVRDLIRDIFSWFDKHFHRRTNTPSNQNDGKHEGVMTLLRWLAYLLLALAGGVLCFLLYKVWKNGWRPERIIRAEVISARPDLNDESVTAAQLPEDEWLRLAHEKLAQGDLRLALRAFYLATLAHLAAREIVTIARFKSNRDYETEVNRRARGSADLRAAFADNVRSFDRAWYGLYEVSTEGVDRFRANFERIRTC